MTTFFDFGLTQDVEKALRELSFSEPTPIQQQAIPEALNGKDLIATAQTGTGKTAAYSIPTAHYLIKNSNATALILAPTRELAMQIEDFWLKLTKYNRNLGSACLIGGASFGMQLRALRRRPRFIIATPGRLIDHLEQGTIVLNQTAVLVLDEADRMLDMGFAPQLEQIYKRLPEKKQTLLFSATWGHGLDKLSKKFLKNPLRISVGETSKAASTIDQFVIRTPVAQKNNAVFDELLKRDGLTLVFARTQIRTDKLASFLQKAGLDVGVIHGGRTQAQRNAALRDFKSGRRRILVATDIAARGIDVTDVAHVINYDLPQMAEDYIHRIGRTGRAGAEGQAVSLVTPEDRGLWSYIVQLLKKTGSQLPKMTDYEPSGRVPAPQPSLSVSGNPAPIKLASTHQPRTARVVEPATVGNGSTNGSPVNNSVLKIADILRGAKDSRLH